MAATNKDTVEEMRRLLDQLDALSLEDNNVGIFIDNLIAKHNLNCPITTGFPDHPAKIRTRNDKGHLLIEDTLYEKNDIVQWNKEKGTSPTTGHTIVEVIDAAEKPKEFQNLYAEVCNEMRAFIEEKYITRRKLTTYPEP